VEKEGNNNDNAEHVENGLLHRSEVTQEEHPLSLGKTSVWNNFFEYTEIMEQIDRDVKRTHPDMHFFCGDSSFAKSNQKFVEADSFFCFVELLSGFRDNFCQKLDNSAVGIRGTLAKLSQLVAKYDAELQHHLEITTEVSLYMLHIAVLLPSRSLKM